MSRLVAFLRAVNVGGRVVSMEALRGHFASEGCTAVASFIASGNIIFTTRVRNPAALSRRIEARLHQALGYDVDTFLRTGQEVAAIAAERPFAAREHAGATAFCVGMLANPLTTAQEKAVVALRTELDAFQVRGREVYWLCHARQSESKFNNAVFERVIRGRATFRSMTTMTRLVDKFFPS